MTTYAYNLLQKGINGMSWAETLYTHVTADLKSLYVVTVTPYLFMTGVNHKEGQVNKYGRNKTS